jgi:Anti-sigma factor NepR
MMKANGDPGRNAFHPTVRSKIGGHLRMLYEDCFSEPLPERRLTLLMQIDQAQGTQREERVSSDAIDKSAKAVSRAHN